MGLLDNQAQLSDSQRVCNAGATEASEDVYDFGVANPNAGRGEPINFHFNVTEVFAGTGTTLTVTLQESSDNDADPYADIVGASTGAIAKATLVAGYEFDLRLPDRHERYVRAMYTGDGTYETTGQIDCNVMLDTQTNRKPGTT